MGRLTEIIIDSFGKKRAVLIEPTKQSACINCSQKSNCDDCSLQKAIAKLSEIEIIIENYDIDRIRELVHADLDGRVKIEHNARKCPKCGKYRVFPRIDGEFFYCFSCKNQFSKKEYTEALKGEQND